MSKDEPSFPMWSIIGTLSLDINNKEITSHKYSGA